MTVENNSKKSGELRMSEKTTKEKKDGATFVVHILHRNNATWQGEVVWANKNVCKPFRSALELLKLIDSALDDEEDLK